MSSNPQNKTTVYYIYSSDGQADLADQSFPPADSLSAQLICDYLNLILIILVIVSKSCEDAVLTDIISATCISAWTKSNISSQTGFKMLAY